MKANRLIALTTVVVALAVGLSTFNVSAASNAKPAKESDLLDADGVPLNEMDVAAAKPTTESSSLTATGEKLLARYSAMQKELQAEIVKLLPNVNAEKKNAFIEAAKALDAAHAAVDKAVEATTDTGIEKLAKAAAEKAKAEARQAGEVAAGLAATNATRSGTATVAGGTPRGLTKTDDDLVDKLLVDEGLVTAPADGPEKMAAAVEKARKLAAIAHAMFDGTSPPLLKAMKKQADADLKVAKEAVPPARSNAVQAAMVLLAEMEPFLASDQLDAKLAKWQVLSGATGRPVTRRGAEGSPRGLAEFAQQGKEQEELVEKLLADDALMKQMVIADGAEGGRYGRAMEIYTAIQKASPKAGTGHFQRLALGIALEHAVPAEQSNAKAETNAPATVDPVKRYLHYEKAWLDGELDSSFQYLTAWDYRMVVNGNESDHILAWGREMLRNYRPDHIATADLRWRYVASVRTEVQYGSGEVKNDRPTLQQYQNIIANGGVCGRRAFFGRFILRAFGIPTIPHPQTGHAALARWTPNGWVICLGAGWGSGKPTKYGRDVDFQATTQARRDEKAYLQVKRAWWIGDVLGEKRAHGMQDGFTGFWNGTALYRQKALIEALKAAPLPPVGQDIGEANESREKEVVQKMKITEADRKIVVADNGVITIPAAAASKSQWGGSRKIVYMKSHDGGIQMHYNRLGPDESFEYVIQAPAAGKYALAAKVVTVSANLKLLLTVNDAQEPSVVPLPYTVGMWQKSEPFEISLTKGENVLQFSRNGGRGVTIKEFTLTPVK